MLVTLVFKSQEEENRALDQQESGLELLAALLVSAIWGPGCLVNWIGAMLASFPDHFHLTLVVIYSPLPPTR